MEGALWRVLADRLESVGQDQVIPAHVRNLGFICSFLLNEWHFQRLRYEGAWPETFTSYFGGVSIKGVPLLYCCKNVYPKLKGTTQ